ncbi:MAG: hypothetical protein IH586_16195 [Anaerolineaceae bacterium]|nr:hypothetical protein [Anaerolineaceae bacterium]
MAGFELSGEVGKSIVRGLGLLFLMWNVPYFFALLNPVKNRLSLYEAVLMQAIGFVGESILLRSVSAEHAVIQTTVYRFIVFDGAGLAALILAAWIVFQARNHTSLPLSDQV